MQPIRSIFNLIRFRTPKQTYYNQSHKVTCDDIIILGSICEFSTWFLGFVECITQVTNRIKNQTNRQYLLIFSYVCSIFR